MKQSVIATGAVDNFLRCNDTTCTLNTYVKALGQRSDEIEQSRDFTIITKDFHQWLITAHEEYSEYFGIHKTQYQPICREYERDDSTIRNSLEINYV